MKTVIAIIHGTDGQEAHVEVSIDTATSAMHIAAARQGTLVIGSGSGDGLKIPASEIKYIEIHPLETYTPPNEAVGA